MKNLIFTIITIASLLSCSNNEAKEDEHFNLDLSINLLVKNSEGVDLLNPNIPNTYNTNNLSTYYILKGVTKQCDYTLIAPENGFTTKYDMRIFPYNYALNDVITYIKWNNTDIDTLKTNYEAGKNFVICTKVLYNNKVVYDQDNGSNTPSQYGSRTIEITK